jgi:hypothetical protein
MRAPIAPFPSRSPNTSSTIRTTFQRSSGS